MDEDEVKLQQDQLKLPPRQTLHLLKYHKLTSNMITIRNNNQSKDVHLYQIRSYPVLTLSANNESNRDVVGYINKRIKEYLHQFVYLKENVIATTILFKSTNSLKLVYGNQPYQVWLIHHKTISLQAINSTNSSSPNYRKSKSYFSKLTARLLNELNFTKHKTNTHYLPQVQYNSLLNYSLLQTFRTSFTYHQASLFVSIKQMNKIIKEETVLDQINNFYKQQSCLSKQQKRIYLNNSYKSKQIISNYGKRTIYFIQQLIFGKNVNQIYINYNNKQITLPQYYQLKYQLTIININQPLIKAKTKKEIFLIPQLMSFVLNPRLIDDTKRQQITKHTKLTPKQQIQQNNNFLLNLKEPLKTNPFNFLNKIGIQLQQYTQLNAYQLNLPTIKTKQKTFSFEDEQIYQSQIDINICLICSNQFKVNNLKSDIVRYANKCGVSHNLISYSYLSSSKEQIVYDIRKIVYIERYTTRKHTTNIFWIIIPSQFKELYSVLKQITFNPNIEIISQITLQSTVHSNKNSNIIQKIICQMAAKVGNRLWVIDKAINTSILMIGIACRYSKDGERIIAYCSNIDINISIYYSHFYVQHMHSSLSLIIRRIVSQAILEFVKINQTVPKQIIILRFQNRDISLEQQTAQSNQIQKAIVNSTSDKNKPKLNYYALGFSHTLQVYLKTGNSFAKPFQGLLIDTQIVNNGNFYIIHQNTKTNQSTKILYRKIYSNSMYPLVQFKQFLYNQTFNYFNSKGTAYIPSVLKYAQKLSKSVYNYSNNNLSITKLRYNLYFL